MHHISITKNAAFVFRYYPLYQIHKDAFSLAYAAEAAGRPEELVRRLAFAAPADSLEIAECKNHVTGSDRWAMLTGRLGIGIGSVTVPRLSLPRRGAIAASRAGSLVSGFFMVGGWVTHYANGSGGSAGK